MRFKNYETWLAEDFAAVGIAPSGNVTGMGPVVSPNSASIGSGDRWDDDTKPAESISSRNTEKKCPVCKKKPCVCEEETEKE